MITTLLFLGIFSVLILKWLQTNKSLPPGPILPLPILRRLFWSEFYKKNDLEIICALEKKYHGVFSVHLGYRKAVLISDFETNRVLWLKYCCRVCRNIFSIIALRNA